MCTKIYQVYRWKTETISTNGGRVYFYHELISEVTFQFGIWFTDKLLGDLFDLNFVINRKVLSLHNEIKHVKRSKSSLDDSSTKSTPSATLKKEVDKDTSNAPLLPAPVLLLLFGDGKVQDLYSLLISQTAVYHKLHQGEYLCVT